MLRYQLRDFLRKLVPAVPLGSLLADLRIDRGVGRYGIEVIELNPYSAASADMHLGAVGRGRLSRTLRFRNLTADL
jgi:hypothetical protein